MDAVKLASDLAAQAMHSAAEKMKTELSSVESYMRTLKDMAGGMWDAITGFFVTKPPAMLQLNWRHVLPICRRRSKIRNGQVTTRRTVNFKRGVRNSLLSTPSLTL